MNCKFPFGLIYGKAGRHCINLLPLRLFLFGKADNIQSCEYDDEALSLMNIDFALKPFGFYL